MVFTFLFEKTQEKSNHNTANFRFNLLPCYFFSNQPEPKNHAANKKKNAHHKEPIKRKELREKWWYPSDLNELSLTCHPKVRLRKRAKKEKNCPIALPLKGVPDYEGEDQSREHKQGHKEEGVVDRNEYENGDSEAQKEDGYENVEK